MVFDGPQNFAPMHASQIVHLSHAETLGAETAGLIEQFRSIALSRLYPTSYAWALVWVPGRDFFRVIR